MRQSGLGGLSVEVGAQTVRLEEVIADFGEPAGAELLVWFDRPATATLHVYGREIADGDLSCSLGARRAAVRMDVRLLARMLAEGLGQGLTLPEDEKQALRAALG